MQQLVIALQLVVVLTDGWDATHGTLRRFERRDKIWVPVADAVPIFVGASGMAWGRGLHPTPPRNEPRKREGDQRAPAGMFRLVEAVGRSPRAAAALRGTPSPWAQGRSRIRYRVSTETLRCVDDPRAKNYNRLAENAASGERMRDYQLAIVVGHNRERRRGDGSCIFLHEGSAPTVGCTAMSAAALDEIFTWIDEKTLLVQLPRAVYARVARKWGLPSEP